MILERVEELAKIGEHQPEKPGGVTSGIRIEICQKNGKIACGMRRNDPIRYWLNKRLHDFGLVVAEVVEHVQLHHVLLIGEQHGSHIDITSVRESKDMTFEITAIACGCAF